MPPEQPLDMPTQRLRRYDMSTRHKAARWPGAWRAWLARLVVFGGGLAVTAYGGWQMYKVIDVGGVTTLKLALLALFLGQFLVDRARLHGRHRRLRRAPVRAAATPDADVAVER